MSRDYHLLVDTTVTAERLREDLAAELQLRRAENFWLYGNAAGVRITAAEAKDLALAEPTIGHATLKATLTPNTRHGQDLAMRELHQLAAAILRHCPGDAVLAPQDSTAALLRLGDVVYIDPRQMPRAWFDPADLAAARIVEGIPDQAALSA
jgi:hypothetical protein